MATLTEKTRATGPYCRPVTLGKLDGRTKQGALMRRVREDLTGHIGGAPSDGRSELSEMRHDLFGEQFHVVDLAVEVASFRAEPEP